MFNHRSKNILNLFHIVKNNSFSNNPSLFFTVRFISKSSSDQSDSFTLSYLQNKLGFSPESALKLSNYVDFKTPEKPDSVIAFLEEHGFSKSQIRQIIKGRPPLLCSDVENTLFPKIQFFQSKGLSGPAISKLLIYNPRILCRSLEKQIIPCFDKLSHLLQSDLKALTAIRRNPYLIPCSFDTYMLPNIKTLIDNGVPESNIISMFNYHPWSFIMLPDNFKEIVKQVKKLGFNPKLLKFLHAVIMFRKVGRVTMESKFDVYKKWGWSEEDIWDAFRKYPGVVEASKEKIDAIMDFLVNEMGVQSLIIANYPGIFARSLEKRIIPRGLFAIDLLSKGLIKNFKFSILFATSEEVFFQRFVNPFIDNAPELLKLYEEKVEVAGKRQIPIKSSFVIVSNKPPKIGGLVFSTSSGRVVAHSSGQIQVVLLRILLDKFMSYCCAFFWTNSCRIVAHSSGQIHVVLLRILLDKFRSCCCAFFWTDVEMVN